MKAPMLNGDTMEREEEIVDHGREFTEVHCVKENDNRGNGFGSGRRNKASHEK